MDQAAIEEKDDLILVTSGTYKENLEISEGVQIRVGGAVLESAEAGKPVITISPPLGPNGKPKEINVEISDLVVQNGKADLGAGILVEEDVSLTLRNVEIKDNEATLHGGGIAKRGNLALEEVQIHQNSAGAPLGETVGGLGGGIYQHGRTVQGVGAGNRIEDNVAGSGGGIFTLGKKVPSLGGFTITDNVGGDCRGNSTQPASTATTDKDGSCVEK